MAKHHVLETRLGRHLDLLDPDGADIHIQDIAWGLARQARFNGHTQGVHAYSVAQHSVWCAWAAQHWFHVKPAGALQALMHDAHEAYTGDIVRPLKYALNVAQIEMRLQAVIHTGLSLPAPTEKELDMIYAVDTWALGVEAHHLMASNGRGWACMRYLPAGAVRYFWSPLPPDGACILFQNIYNDLRSGRALPDDLLEVLG